MPLIIEVVTEDEVIDRINADDDECKLPTPDHVDPKLRDSLKAASQGRELIDRFAAQKEQ